MTLLQSTTRAVGKDHPGIGLHFYPAISNDISVIIVNDRQYFAVPASVGLGIYALSPEFRVPTIGSLLYVFAV
jgi:hypothetical protein